MQQNSENYRSGLIDTHAHLSMIADRGIPVEERLDELFAAGFGGIIDIGTKADDLRGRIEAYSRFEKVRFGAGIWPWEEAIAARAEQAAILERHIREAAGGLVAAVGECGLDRHWNKEEALIRGERELLEAQLDLAGRLGLPIIIHSREAAEETAEALSRYPGLRGVIHCFSYGVAEAKTFLDMGYYLSFAGTITYKNTAALREALLYVPGDRLVLETDSPFLAPVPHRGKPADPGMVAEVYRLAGELRKADPGELRERIAQNVQALFGPWG
ncbi:MAG: TatD family hydrolase [Spirochaetaceae bacterium]|jgi:TatD DNase family protein|nr:TatD family hydrolase [Spirochaetaceae bacterium]